MSSILDKYRKKKVAVDALKQQHKASGFGGGSNDRADFLSIDDGSNRFRVFPPHLDDGGETFTEPKCVSWLSVEVDEYDDAGNKTGDKVRKRKPVFNSAVHGNPAIAVENSDGKTVRLDLIEMYIDFAKEKLKESFDRKADYDEQVEMMYDWQTGIYPKKGWVFYAFKYIQDKSIFGLLEISNGLKKKINEL